MENWNGEDRRASNVSLQDILLEVRECRNDIGYLKKTFDSHILDDKENFAGIKKDVTFLQRCAFGLFGAWAFFQLLVSVGTFNFNNNASSPNNSNYSVGNHGTSDVGRH